MQLPPTLPSWARSEASIFFPTQNFKIRKGRRSFCEILRYPLWLGVNLLFPSQLKILWSERDVVAAARFSNFKSLYTHNSFDNHKIPTYRWPSTHRLPAARFSADLKQLQKPDFSTSNRSKPIRVLTRTKCSCSVDRLPISYSLPDFQQI